MEHFNTVALPPSKCGQQMVSSLGAHQSDNLPLLLCVEYVQTVLSARKKGERSQVMSFLPQNSQTWCSFNCLCLTAKAVVRKAYSYISLEEGLAEYQRHPTPHTAPVSFFLGQ